MPTLRSHTHLQATQADTQTKACKRVACPTAQPDTTKTVKLSIDNDLQGRWTEGQLITAVWRNGGFSASYVSFVVGSSAVLTLNFCAITPCLFRHN